MTHHPAISVIMPVYNGATYMQEAIESILFQTFPDFELIIVDDGSTDHSREIARSYHDKRLKYIDLQHAGCFPARNTGMRAAQGKYVCPMDADDISLPKRLETQFCFLEENDEFGLVSTALRYMDASSPIYKETDPGIIKMMMLKFSYLASGPNMIRHSLIQKYNLYYEEQFVYASDYAWMSRASWLFPVTNINQCTYLYRMHGQQISSAKRQEQNYYADIIRLRQLSSLGINVPDEDKPVLSAFIQGWPLSKDLWDKADQWYQQLLSINKSMNYYPQIPFQDFLNVLMYSIKR